MPSFRGPGEQDAPITDPSTDTTIEELLASLFGGSNASSPQQAVSRGIGGPAPVNTGIQAGPPIIPVSKPQAIPDLATTQQVPSAANGGLALQAPTPPPTNTPPSMPAFRGPEQGATPSSIPPIPAATPSSGLAPTPFSGKTTPGNNNALLSVIMDMLMKNRNLGGGMAPNATSLVQRQGR